MGAVVTTFVDDYYERLDNAHSMGFPTKKEGRAGRECAAPAKEKSCYPGKTSDILGFDNVKQSANFRMADSKFILRALLVMCLTLTFGMQSHNAVIART